MSPQLTIRRAGSADLRELARLRWDFTAELHPGRTVEPRADFDRRFAATVSSYFASGRWSVWVAAEESGRLAGALWLERVDKVPRPYPRPESWGYVTNVYVEPPHRNAGLGGRLLDAAIVQARADGLEQLVLWPSQESGRFYARAGFRPDTELLTLEITPDVGERSSSPRSP